MSRKVKGEHLGPFVPLLKETLDSPGWRAMSHGARSLYVCLKRRYNSKQFNNGRLHVSQRQAAKEIGSAVHGSRTKREERCEHRAQARLIRLDTSVWVRRHSKEFAVTLPDVFHAFRSVQMHHLTWVSECPLQQPEISFSIWSD